MLENNHALGMSIMVFTFVISLTENVAVLTSDFDNVSQATYVSDSIACDTYTFSLLLLQLSENTDRLLHTYMPSIQQCYDPAPIFHFPPPPQVIPTTPSPPVTQPAHAQQAPVRCQSPASILLPPSPLPMDRCPPSPPSPTLTHIMPQSDLPNLVDAYMHTTPSSPKAKYLWKAFNHAKEYASEARDRTPPPLPMDAESTTKSCHHEACDSSTTPITPATRCHSPSPEAPYTRRNSEDSYNDRKDPSHPLYQYNYREAY